MAVELSPTLLFHLADTAGRGSPRYGVILGLHDADAGVKYAQAGFEVPAALGSPLDMEYFQTRLRQMLTVWPQKSVVGMYVFSPGGQLDHEAVAMARDLGAFVDNLYGQTTQLIALAVDPQQFLTTGTGVFAYSVDQNAVLSVGVALSSDTTEMIATTTIARREKYFASDNMDLLDDSGYTYEQHSELLVHLVDALRLQVEKIVAFATAESPSNEKEAINRKILQLSRILLTSSLGSDISSSLLSAQLSILTKQLAAFDKLKAVSRKAVIGYKNYEQYGPVSRGQ